MIRDGIPRLYQQELGKSYRYPSGRQAVRFHDPQTGRILVVAHSFEAPEESPLHIPLPAGTWKTTRVFGDPSPTLRTDGLHLDALPGFSGAALLLES